MTQIIDPCLVDAVVAESAAQEQRLRLLPARVVVYFVLALAFLDWIVGLVDEVMAERSLDGEPDIDAALLRDVAVAVFEGANVPNDRHRNRPAHEMRRFLMESILVGRSPIKGRDH